LVVKTGKVYDARILVFENARNGLLTPTSWFHCDSITVFKALFPGQKSYALGKLYSEKFSKDLKDAHTADADANAIRELMLIGDTDKVHAAIARNRESFSSVAKRCFK
jgi:DNA polymerase III alpha subunit (gram-positive type)